MAFSSALVWQVQNGGSDTLNGGAFRGGANLTTPSAPTVTPSASGGTVAASTYYVVLTLSDGNGETPKSAQTAVTTSGATASFTVTSPTDPVSVGATWNVYVGTTSGGPYFSQGTGLAFGANRTVTTTPPTTGTQAPGVDYSQQAAAQVALTDMIIDGTTNTLFTSATLAGSAAYVGNVINVTGGTGFTVQRVEITGVSSAGKYTVERSLGTLSSTGGTGNLGGALATPGMADGLAVSGNGLFIKYSVTAYSVSASASVSGGRLATGNLRFIVGYDTTRGKNNADANRPTLAASAASVTAVFYPASAGSLIANLIASANGQTGFTGFSLSSSALASRNLKVSGGATGFLCASVQMLLGCHADSCTTVGFNCAAGALVGCVATSCALGYSLGGNVVSVGCLAANCTGIGFEAISTYNILINCTSYHNTYGYWIDSSGPCGALVNCVAYNNTTAGFRPSSAPAVPGSVLQNCAAGGTGLTLAAGWMDTNLSGFLTLTADPFTNAASLDFSLNSTAGGGALLKGAGYPSAPPGLSTTSYPNVGAVQSQASSGGSLRGIQLGAGGVG